MNGLYLYCIRERRQEEFRAQGIFKEDRVFSLPYKNLEAIVSEVPIAEMTGDQLHKKAQEDLSWIKEKAQLHEAVIEKAMKIGCQINPVIPMRFGTIFHSRQKIEQTLEQLYQNYTQCLLDLKYKQEWSVKIYLTLRAAIESEIMEKEPSILARKKEIAAMPKGMAYFFQSQVNEMLQTAVHAHIESYAQRVFLTLNQYACHSMKGKILEKAFTGKKEPMVLNAIFLIFEEKISAFINEVDQLDATMNSRGLKLELSGPWPPYNFVKV